MKIIIIEGTDRTGKDTLINELKNLFERVLIIHCTTPKGDTIEEKIEYQNKSFNKYIDDLYADKYHDVCDCMIFNRSWYGEYVYGQLFRNRTEEDVTALIKDIDERLIALNDDYCQTKARIYYIQLVNDSLKLRTELDDGNSLSTNIDVMKRETELFTEIFNKSLVIDKKLIRVNDCDVFRDKTDIFNEVREFVSR